eukprot:767240-Hanusia_phi.AAC.8
MKVCAIQIHLGVADISASVLLYSSVNEVCKWKQNIAPNKKRLYESASSGYALLSTLGELFDNAIESVNQNPKHKKKQILLCLDLVERSLSVKDNGIGCADLAKMLIQGSEKADIGDRYNPNCKFFSRYFVAIFSRFGVGSKNASYFLGKQIRISSKAKGQPCEYTIEDLGSNDFIADSKQTPISDETALETSYCRICIDEFKTDLLMKGNMPDFEGWEEAIKNLRMMYFMFLGEQEHGFFRIARKIIQASQNTCIPKIDSRLDRRTKEGKAIVKLNKDMDMLTQAMRMETRSKESSSLPFELRFKLIYADENGERHEEETAMTESTCCLDKLLGPTAKDCFPIYLDLGDEDSPSGRTIVMGAVFYFPNVGNQETIEFVDRLYGLSCAENRRFMTFWMGRWLLADAFMPEFMMNSDQDRNTNKCFYVPGKCFKRAFGIMFVDRGIEPESKKISLHQGNMNLARLKKAFKDTNFVESYRLWLGKCHRKYDAEVTFEDEEQKYDEETKMFSHKKITFSGQQYEENDYVELFEGEMKAQSSNMDVGQIMKFLQSRNEKNKGKVVLRLLQANNSYEEVQRNIPEWSMRLIGELQFEQHKENNRQKIPHKARFMSSKKSIRAGEDCPLKLEILNYRDERIVFNSECELIVKFADATEQRYQCQEAELLAPFSSGADWLQKAGQYTLSVVSISNYSITCEPFNFAILPGDVSEVKLDVGGVIPITFGVPSSLEGLLVDKYGNNITPEPSHRPRLEIQSNDVRLQFEPVFLENKLKMRMEIKGRGCGDLPAALVVTSKEGKDVRLSFTLKALHGDPKCIEVECSEKSYEMINFSDLPELDCVVKDVFGNVCNTMNDATVYVTSTDLWLPNNYISHKLSLGECNLQTDKQLKSLYFYDFPRKNDKEPLNCSAVRGWESKRRNQDPIGEPLQNAWADLMTAPQKPFGFFNRFHGFFSEGDWVMVRFQGPRGYEARPGRIESVRKEQGKARWYIKYFKVESSNSRLLLPCEGELEVLGTETIDLRLFVLHTSLMEHLDSSVLSKNVYFCSCAECPTELTASLDVFLHNDSLLLHRRLSFPLTTSRFPARGLIYNRHGKLGHEIEVEHGAELGDLSLELRDEAMGPCSHEAQVDVRGYWEGSIPYKPGRQQQFRLPSLRVTRDQELSLEIQSGQDIKFHVPLSVRVKRGVPARLKLQVEGTVVVGETFMVQGVVCDSNGLEIKDLGGFEIEHESYTFKFKTEEGEETNVVMKDNYNRVVSQVEGKGNITCHDRYFVMRNAVIMCKPVTGTLSMEMKIRPYGEYGGQWYELRDLQTKIQPNSGEARELVLQNEHVQTFPLEIFSHTVYPCDIHFKVTDSANNNLSENWSNDVFVTFATLRKPQKLVKWVQEGRETVFRLTEIPPLRSGSHMMTVQTRSSKKNSKTMTLSLRVDVAPGNIVQRLSVQVDNRQNLKPRQTGELMADFTARITFHTENGQTLRGLKSKVPDVKLFCSKRRKAEEIAASFSPPEGNDLICKFSLRELGLHTISAEFKDTRYPASEKVKSESFQVNVEPGKNNMSCFFLSPSQTESI